MVINYMVQAEDGHEAHAEGEHGDQVGAHDAHDVPDHVLDAEQNRAEPVVDLKDKDHLQKK